MEYGQKTITKDIPLLCAQAESFPEGIIAAFKKLEAADPAFGNRKFYGLSRGMRDGGIEYWAAVEMQDPAEPQRTGLDQKTLKNGPYAAVRISEFRKNPAMIGNAFTYLLGHVKYDRDSWCVEVYSGDNVECMVRLTES